MQINTNDITSKLHQLMHNDLISVIYFNFITAVFTLLAQV